MELLLSPLWFSFRVGGDLWGFILLLFTCNLLNRRQSLITARKSSRLVCCACFSCLYVAHDVKGAEVARLMPSNWFSGWELDAASIYLCLSIFSRVSARERSPVVVLIAVNPCEIIFSP